MFAWLTGTHLGKLVATFLISLVPVVELRGGIPFGVAQGLPLWEAYIAAVLGNLLPVPFIILFLRHIFLWLHRFEKTSAIVTKLEERAHLKGEKVEKYRNKIKIVNANAELDREEKRAQEMPGLS